MRKKFPTGKYGKGKRFGCVVILGYAINPPAGARTNWRRVLCDCGGESDIWMPKSSRPPRSCIHCRYLGLDASEKTCRECGQVKPLEDFTKDKRMRGGRLSLCKQCRQARARKNYLQNCNEDPEYHNRQLARNRKNHHQRKGVYGVYFHIDINENRVMYIGKGFQHRSRSLTGRRANGHRDWILKHRDCEGAIVWQPMTANDPQSDSFARLMEHKFLMLHKLVFGHVPTFNLYTHDSPPDKCSHPVGDQPSLQKIAILDCIAGLFRLKQAGCDVPNIEGLIILAMTDIYKAFSCKIRKYIFSSYLEDWATEQALTPSSKEN